MRSAMCEVCHRALKDPRSIEIGMGPVCAGKVRRKEYMEDNDRRLEETRKLINALFGAMDETGAYFIPESVRDFELRRVNGEPSADVPHKLVYHSPTGFEWGYGGSGPADLALNILASFLPLRQAWALHQPFKWRFIATMPREGGTIKGDDIRQFLKENAPCTGE